MRLGGHLASNVVAREDGLEVEPRRLHFQPVVNNLLQVGKRLLPDVDSTQKRFHVARPAHGLRPHDLVIQLLLDLVDAGEDAPRAPLLGLKGHGLPRGLHLLQVFVQRGLLGSRDARVLDEMHVMVQPDVHQLQHVRLRRHLKGQSCCLLDLGPVPGLHALFADEAHQRHLVLLKGRGLLDQKLARAPRGRPSLARLFELLDHSGKSRAVFGRPPRRVLGVHFVKGHLVPRVRPLDPFPRNRPQLVQRPKLFGDDVQASLVVRGLQLQKVLLRRHRLAVALRRLQTLAQRLDAPRHHLHLARRQRARFSELVQFLFQRSHLAAELVALALDDHLQVLLPRVLQLLAPVLEAFHVVRPRKDLCHRGDVVLRRLEPAVEEEALPLHDLVHVLHLQLAQSLWRGALGKGL
mmetsp:Transcript_32178/g.113287  ORF Transcript_32178/g.113287 Transcript_32178/m.113287 type:complete len:407 (+) Transcript_32178:439-1659(+)